MTASLRAIGMFWAIPLLLAILIAPPARADLVDGLAAYDQGDYETALAEWMPLAEGGDAQAQSLLGLLYRGVPGIPGDAAESVRWYQLAAEQGHAHAQYNLGLAYQSGQGIARDDIAAYMWLEVAARGIPMGPDGTNAASQRRDALAAGMSAADIAEATRQAESWMAAAK